jgi:hypothetical protein
LLLAIIFESIILLIIVIIVIFKSLSLPLKVFVDLPLNECLELILLLLQPALSIIHVLGLFLLELLESVLEVVSAKRRAHPHEAKHLDQVQVRLENNILGTSVTFLVLISILLAFLSFSASANNSNVVFLGGRSRNLSVFKLLLQLLPSLLGVVSSLYLLGNLL